MAGELVVRQGIDQCRRLRTIGFGSVGRPHDRIRERELGQGRRGHRRVSKPSRRIHRALGRFVHLLVPRAPECVDGELEHERHRLARALIGEALEGARQTVTGLILSAEIALHAGTGAGEPGTQRGGVVGHDREGVQQRAVAVVETADRRQRSRASEEKLDALLRRRGRRQQAQGFREPVRGARRRQPDGFLAGLAQHGDCARVALARRALDVMGAGRSCGPPRRERLGAALVGAQSPAAGRRLVDRATNERMPKTEASGHVGCANQIEFQQLVDRLHHGGLRHLGRGRGQLRLERIACHRRSFQHETFGVRQERELLCERRGDGRRNSDRRQRRLVVYRRCSARAVERPGELFEIEGVAAALRIEDARVDAIDRVAQ